MELPRIHILRLPSSTKPKNVSTTIPRCRRLGRAIVPPEASHDPYAHAQPRRACTRPATWTGGTGIQVNPNLADYNNCCTQNFAEQNERTRPFGLLGGHSHWRDNYACPGYRRRLRREKSRRAPPSPIGAHRAHESANGRLGCEGALWVRSRAHPCPVRQAMQGGAGAGWSSSRHDPLIAFMAAHHSGAG
jgi:hypothetical protein